MGISTYGLQDIKKEIAHLPNEQIAELCLRLARYKKENKELLSYLLFEASNEHGFIENIKAELGFMFSQLPSLNYNAAKSMRKTLRLISKYVKFIGSKEAEIDLLICFCANYNQYADRKATYKPMRQILGRALLKIKTLISKLHEDLQFDFKNDYENLLHESEKRFPWFIKTDFLL